MQITNMSLFLIRCRSSSAKKACRRMFNLDNNIIIVTVSPQLLSIGMSLIDVLNKLTQKQECQTPVKSPNFTETKGTK